MDKETFEKARRYGRDKTRYALSKCLFDQVLSWALIRMNVYSQVWEYAGKAMNKLGLDQSRTVRSSFTFTCSQPLLPGQPISPLHYHLIYLSPHLGDR
jgi:hypothetical protein